jgi:hypothetical protein
VIQITDNLTYTTGNHTLTFGSSFEKYAFENSFNLEHMIISVDLPIPVGYYGTFRSYSSVDAFLLDAAQPFASSSIKQNLQYAQNTYDSRNFAVGGIKDGN